MHEHPINQTINEIDVYVYGEERLFYEVGQNGVTRIEACEKSGMYSNIPYIRVWAGDHCLAEFCQHSIVGVYFAKEEHAQGDWDHFSGVRKMEEATVTKTAIVQPATPTDAAPRYVFGPKIEAIEGDRPFPRGVEYQWRGKICVVPTHDDTIKGGPPTTIRRAYRIGQSYPHDGGECPLADGSVRVETSAIDPRGAASDFNWDNITWFIPLGEGKANDRE